jgi:hypothetical protein
MSGAIPQVLHMLHRVTIFQALLSSNILSQTGTPYGLVTSFIATYVSEQPVVFIFTAHKQGWRKKVPPKRWQLPALSRQLDVFFSTHKYSAFYQINA